MQRLEAKYAAKIRKVYREIHNSIEEDLHNYLEKIPKLREAIMDDKGTEPKIPKKLVQQLLDIFEKAWVLDSEKMENLFISMHNETAQYGRERAIKDVNVSVAASDFINPQVKQYFKEQAATRVKGIHDSTVTYLRQQLEEAYMNKETVPEWEARIERVVDCNYPRGRAEMIAQTELAWAYNKGLIETYKELGVQKVRWLAVLDNRTCNQCKEYALKDEIFTLAELPEIPLHPRCRCTVISADDE